ncbi:ProQ/FINO family protein [Oryzisolibacter sp. LB2S]|uniref:ProQ/FINO family protein n=1 Tax=Alicycliphilus soli TaxID=3228789 RepID=UPI0034597F4F
MNDNVTSDQVTQQASAEAASSTPAIAPVADAAPQAAEPGRPAGRRGGRGGRGGRRRGGERREPAAQDGQATPAPEKTGAARPQPRRTHLLLEQLAAWYPQLFGAQFLPLKRGIFHDLMAAHGEAIDKDALKLALSIHTRSTRYLNAVAQGMKRHDLQGQPVEDMAPEHVHHALLEVFRRRKPREGEDLAATLRRRIAQAFEASGLTREAYDALVRGRDERANALLDEAFAEVAERDARAEALARAFEASGATPAQFADMYGMDVHAVQRALARARQLRGA